MLYTVCVPCACMLTFLPYHATKSCPSAETKEVVLARNLLVALGGNAKPCVSLLSRVVCTVDVLLSGSHSTTFLHIHASTYFGWSKCTSLNTTIISSLHTVRRLCAAFAFTRTCSPREGNSCPERGSRVAGHAGLIV